MDDFNDYDRSEAIIEHANQFNWNKSAMDYLNVYRQTLAQ
jgi:glycogen synthase